MPKSFCFFFKKNKNMMHTNNHPHSSGQSPGLEQPRPPCVLPAFHPCMLLIVFVNNQTSSSPCFHNVLNLFELIVKIPALQDMMSLVLLHSCGQSDASQGILRLWCCKKNKNGK